MTSAGSVPFEAAANPDCFPGLFNEGLASFFGTYFVSDAQATKPKKLALTAVMRKLIVLLNHLLKNPQFKLARKTVADPIRSLWIIELRETPETANGFTFGLP